MLSCVVDPIPTSAVTYVWQCDDACFIDGRTEQNITRILTDMDSSEMIECSVTINSTMYNSTNMFELAVTQGTYYTDHAVCMCSVYEIGLGDSIMII